jgi:hypothetical protein
MSRPGLADPLSSRNQLFRRSRTGRTPLRTPMTRSSPANSPSKTSRPTEPGSSQTRPGPRPRRTRPRRLRRVSIRSGGCGRTRRTSRRPGPSTGPGPARTSRSRPGHPCARRRSRAPAKPRTHSRSRLSRHLRRPWTRRPSRRRSPRSRTPSRSTSTRRRRFSPTRAAGQPTRPGLGRSHSWTGRKSTRSPARRISGHGTI